MGPRRRAAQQQGLTPQFPLPGAAPAASAQQPHVYAASMLSAASVEPYGGHGAAQQQAGAAGSAALSAIHSGGGAELAASGAAGGALGAADGQAQEPGANPLQGDADADGADMDGNYYPPGIDLDGSSDWAAAGQAAGVEGGHAAASAGADGQDAWPMDTADHDMGPMQQQQDVDAAAVQGRDAEGGALGAATPFHTRQARARQAGAAQVVAEPFDPYAPLDPHDKGTLAVKPMQVRRGDSACIQHEPGRTYL